METRDISLQRKKKPCFLALYLNYLAVTNLLFGSTSNRNTGIFECLHSFDVPGSVTALLAIKLKVFEVAPA